MKFAPAPLIAPFALVASGLIAACATAPAEPVQEQIDRDTATTVLRLGAPIELLATAPRERNADPFAYLAPFETNRMGERQLYLWASFAGDGMVMPAVHCGELVATLAARLAGGMPPAGMGLSRLPYRAPAAWNAVHVIPIDTRWLDCLASGARLGIEIGEDRFASDGSRDRDLAAFSERVRE